MNDKELLEYMRKVNTNFNTHLENGTIEMSLEYYNLCEELMARGINAMQENQQLKEKLQQKEDVINKAKVDLEKHLDAKSYGNHKYELFDRKYLEEVLEILNSKGEQK